jgi:hypothetical protein
MKHAQKSESRAGRAFFLPRQPFFLTDLIRIKSLSRRLCFYECNRDRLRRLLPSLVAAVCAALASRLRRRAGKAGTRRRLFDLFARFLKSRRLFS